MENHLHQNGNKENNIHVNEIEKMPVVFASSNTYIVQTFVAAYSLMFHSLETIELHFLLHEDCNEDAVLLLKKLESLFNNCTCVFHTIDRRVFENSYLGEQHVLTTTYYRLLIPLLLSNYEKCLYLDSDVIVEKALTNLYELPMEECVVAGVLAAGYQNIRRNGAEYCKQIGLAKIDQYINAGILLMRPSEIYNCGLYHKWMQLSKNQYPVLDQDIINISCYGRILLLPPWYNAMTTHFNYKVADLIRIYTEDDIEHTRNNPSIIHYTSPQKPWNSDTNSVNMRWWNVFKTILQDKELENLIFTVDETFRR